MTGLLHGAIRLVALFLVGAGNWLVLTALVGFGFIISEKILGTMALPPALLDGDRRHCRRGISASSIGV